MNWKKFLKHYNGWLGFAVGSVLFFTAPPLYRYIDPTAGTYDAGYIMPVIYSMTVISFASGFAWLMVKLTAPGIHKHMDEFLERESFGYSVHIKTGLILFAAYFGSIVWIITSMV